MKGVDFIKTKQILWVKRKNIELKGSQEERGLKIYTKEVENKLLTH